MDARDHVAHTGLDTSFIAQVGDILTSLANDDARFLGGDDRTEGQHRLRISEIGRTTDAHTTRSRDIGNNSHISRAGTSAGCIDAPSEANQKPRARRHISFKWLVVGRRPGP